MKKNLFLSHLSWVRTLPITLPRAFCPKELGYASRSNEFRKGNDVVRIIGFSMGHESTERS